MNEFSLKVQIESLEMRENYAKLFVREDSEYEGKAYKKYFPVLAFKEGCKELEEGRIMGGDNVIIRGNITNTKQTNGEYKITLILKEVYLLDRFEGIKVKDDDKYMEVHKEGKVQKIRLNKEGQLPQHY